MEDKVYPKFDWNSQKDDVANRYYVEFDRHEDNTFTLFKRNFIQSDAHGFWEVHPYQLFSGFCKKNCVPDKTWVKWMVDQLNKGVQEPNLEEEGL